MLVFITIAQPKMVPSFSLTFIDLVFHSTGLTAVQSVKYLWILCSSDNLYFNWLGHLGNRGALDTLN